VCVTVVIPPKGRLVLLGWAAIPCCLLAPFFFWRGVGPGCLFLLAALVLCFAVYARSISFVAAADGALLCVFSGVLFTKMRRVPLGSVCGAQRMATPLLSLAGCRIVVFYTAGGAVYLPALSREDAEALCAWARQDAPEAAANSGSLDIKPDPAKSSGSPAAPAPSEKPEERP
jgi:membrane protein YdbS with pleckstrin-like domain